MSPEIELILRCLRARSRGEAAPSEPAAIDFDRLLGLCERHGVMALVGDGSPATRELSRPIAARAARSLLLAHELDMIVEDLSGASIEVIAYKGPALALEAYGDVTLRSFTDLDLVVRPEDFERARAVLDARGYRTSPPEVRDAPRWLVERSECDETMVNGPFFVELHWAVTPPDLAFPLSTEDLFRRSRKRPDLAALVPSLEDQIVLLAMNGAKDAWSRLEVLCAFTALARREVDWERVEQLSRQLHAERMLRIAFALGERLLGARPPITPARDRIATLLASQVARHHLDAVPSSVQRSALSACARERARDAASVLFGRLFTPTWRDATLVRLPRPLAAAYYLVRPLRLAMETVRGTS